MAGKPGMKWKQPRVGDPHYESDVPDPAKGEKVPRCFACGSPKLEILPGLWAFARFHVELPLHQDCIDKAKSEWPDRCATCQAALHLRPGFWRYAARPGHDLIVCEPCLRCAAARDDTADIVALEDVA